MQKYYIDKNNQKHNLASMSIDQLNLLNYQEECYFASRIRKLPAFSKKRSEYSHMAYEKIFQIADFKKLKDKNYRKKGANGSTMSSVELLIDLIKCYKKIKTKITIYEAGVGSAYAINKIKNIPNIKIYGCDVFLSDEAKKLKSENINLEEKSLYDHLKKIPDNFIDIFYADNVLEHIVGDEYEDTIKLIFKKLQADGVMYLVIPNGSIGPSDVSRYYLKEGSKALGFHFMERSYKENMETFMKFHIRSKYLAYRNKENKLKLIKANLFFDRLKILLESKLLCIKDKKRRHKLFKLLGYDTYILKKQK